MAELRPPPIATTFSIFGPRGAGKTTVLINAEYVTKEPESFFRESGESWFRQDEQQQLQQRLVWLPVIDIDHLPEHANLLTTLLVHVRSALLKAPAFGSPQQVMTPVPAGLSTTAMPSHLLEEGLDDAWTSFDDLIRAATSMWEAEIVGPDPNRQAETVMSRALTYVDFRDELKATLEIISRHLQRCLSTSQDLQFVLRIDNADRSATHLYQMTRLLSMAQNPRLWFVLAAHPQYLEAFLETSYRSKLGLGGGESGERLTTIARRQAATAVATLLPISHRVELNRLEPRYALETLKDDAEHTLSGVLKALPVSCALSRAENAEVCKGLGCPQRLEELLVFPCKEACGNPIPLRPAAALAFSVPIRRALDVLEFAQWKRLPDGETSSQAPRGINATCESNVVRANLVESSVKSVAAPGLDCGQVLVVQATLGEAGCSPGRESRKSTGPGSEEESTIDFVAHMLRTAVYDSEMPDWAIGLILKKMMLCDDKRRECLDYGNRFIVSHPTRLLRSEVPLERSTRKASERAYLLSCSVQLYESFGYKLTLQEADGATGKRRILDLPQEVAGWLMLLHDLLRFHRDKRLFGVDCGVAEDPPTLLETRHVLAWRGRTFDIRIPWPMPIWHTFFDSDRIRFEWSELLNDLMPEGECAAALASSDRGLAALLAVAWIERISSLLGVADSVQKDAGAAVVEHVNSVREAMRREAEDGSWAQSRPLDELEGLVRVVWHALSHRYRWLVQKAMMFRCPRRTIAVKEWIENEAPLLLLPEVVGCHGGGAMAAEAIERLTLPLFCSGNGDGYLLKARDMRVRRWFRLRDCVRASPEFRQIESDGVVRGDARGDCEDVLSEITEDWIRAFGGEEDLEWFKQPDVEIYSALRNPDDGP